MTLHTYAHKLDTSCPRFETQHIHERMTVKYWTTDGSIPKPSESRLARFDEVDDLAESMGLTAWYNGH
jgi:hypothetical protein